MAKQGLLVADAIPDVLAHETAIIERYEIFLLANGICPTHGIGDCSPLLNGCSVLTRAHETRDHA